MDRCLNLYETLPEEGGRAKRTGGKQEEAMLSGLREATDVICTQLSEDIFDSLLGRIYDFASTNTKLNSMKAFCQLLRRVARTRPQKTLAKFVPFCVRQIRTEIEHGAASIPTTSTLDIVHSDTALLWRGYSSYNLLLVVFTFPRFIAPTSVNGGIWSCCQSEAGQSAPILTNFNSFCNTRKS